MHTFLMILQIISGIIVIVLVLMQRSKSEGLQFTSSSGVTETFFAKNKSRTSEVKLIKATVVFSVIFAVTTILMNIIK